MEKIVNLVNIKVTDKKAHIEMLYKTNKEEHNIQAYLEGKQDKYCFDVRKYPLTQEIDYLKLTTSININTLDKLKFILQEDDKTYNNIIFLDNKDEKISNLDIKYKIFSKKYVITIDSENASFSITKRKLLERLKYELSKILKARKKYNKWYILNLFKTKEKYYLLNDRIMYGDDNAEELFDYINKNDKQMSKNTYFVLDKNSPNMAAIAKKGKVLKYGSFSHKLKYINSKMVISSHASYYDRVFNPFDKQEMEVYKNNINKQFVFLQHGVIMNDVHNILNREHILADLFITTTENEYKDVKQNYMYNEEEVVCTGLSRFDKLKDERKKIILIAPTWRAFLSDVKYAKGSNDSLENSEFYKKYQNLLNHKDLLETINKYEYRIQFLLHPASEEYKESFLNLKKENIDILSTKDIRYSTLFKECSLFITDYSSTHFDLAFLQKPIIYYQFDQEKFFSSHYNRGYFDYGQDGFGELIEREEELVDKIIFYIKNNCEIEPKYKEIIKKTFRYLDCNNAQRTLEEIKKISNKNEKNYRFNSVH